VSAFPGGVDGELWRDGVALIRARIAEDHDAVRFLLDNTASLRDLAELVLGFSYEVWLQAMGVRYPDASRAELARLAEEICTSELRQAAAGE